MMLKRKTKPNSLKLIPVIILGAILLAPIGVMAECNGVQLSIPIGGQDCVSEGEVITTYLGWIVRFLAAGVGVVVTLMIVVSGIQYIMSSGNPEGLQKAKAHLTHAVMALVLFIFMAALLNFVIPGGIL